LNGTVVACVRVLAESLHPPPKRFPAAAQQSAYKANGFRLVRETDGVGNEEREPDALFVWSR
jgi:hypothetical protein